MSTSQNLQPPTLIITNSEEEIITTEEENSSLNNNAINVTLLKIEEDKYSGLSSIFDSSIDSSDESNKFSDERKEFVTKCKQELNSSKLPEHFEQWKIEKQYDHLIKNIGKYFPNIPDSLRYVLPAIFENGDCGREANAKPDWLIMDKFYRGQRFAQRYFSMIAISNLMGLMQIFSFSDGLKPLILSQKSNTPYRAFERYLRTIKTFRNWYTSDPWCEGTPAYRDIQRVRKLHCAMRRKLCGKNFEEIDQGSKIQNAWCPVLGKITKDFADSCPMAKNQQCPYTMTRTRGLNQGDMSGTQFASMGLIVLYPEQFGIHDASDEDLEAFCHLWRGLGYLLGIEDHYNFCRGSLKDVRQRTEDFIEHWVKPNFRTVTPEWEHMTMCLNEGVGYIAHLNNYKVLLLRLCDIFGFSMPRLYDSFSLPERMLYMLQKYLFSYIVKLPGIFSIMNAVLNSYLDQAADFGYSKRAELKKRSLKKISKIVYI
ncbi:PREDICTED: uncharacterized protein LOC105455016 [Wasmannia auropunctata]|uniref:uncharacterized protein LOC105455016 n=1 Tax=Wasmannia auropunctata TaxID=64793 RepID=UPI0005EEBA3E|nr:PREDICTED: uncharacterized protein LOC105455016 [Wasmannia auropunctata]